MSPTRDSAEHARLIALLTEHTGMELVGTRRDTALAAIEGAMADAGVHSVAEYHARIAAGDRDLERLVDAVSIGETYFFREPTQFDFIREEVIPEIKAARGPDTPLQMWSAACSTGEETYSLAILLEETGITPISKVLGTDISRAAINGARAARYRPWSLRTLDREWTERYFTLDDSYYRLHEHLRQRATFGQHNLVGVGPTAAVMHDSFDVIFLRNVLIYFDRPTVDLIVKRIAKTLRHGGWLVTASCDPPIEGINELQPVSKRGCVFYRRTKGHKTFVDLAGLEMSPVEVPKPLPAPIRLPEPNAAAHDETHHHELALRAFENGDYEEVLRLTRDHPEHAEARSLSARAVANLSGTPAAYREVERACLDHPLCVELHYLRGLFLSDLGRDDDAADAFRRVTYLEPHLALAHYALGRVLAKTGDRRRAARAFQTAHELCDAMNPTDTLPLSDDEHAAQLAQAARIEIDILRDAEGDSL